MTIGAPTARSIAAFQGWRALRHRNYRLWFGGQAISLIGTWMQMVAQGWLVLELSGDPFILGMVAAAQYAPVLIFGLFGGLVADGLPKRKVLIGTQSVAMTMALILFVLSATHLVQVWQVILVALGLGLANAIDMPTRNSFSVEMVGREDVGNAVALNSALFNGARILGPAVAGLTIGAFDISIAFLLNGLSYIAVIVGLVMMRDTDLQSPPRMPRPASVRAALASLGEGLGYVRRTPIVLMAVVLVGIVSTFGMNWTVLVPALAHDVLASDASGYGFLMSASGLGALISALTIAFSRRSRPAFIAGGAIVLGLFEVLLGWSRFFPLSLAAMFVIGIGSIAMSATANTTVQMTVPDQLRGRVLSVYMTIFVGSTPIGSLIMGAVASRFGADVALMVGGAVSAAAAAGAMVWYRRIRAADRRRAATARDSTTARDGAAARDSTARDSTACDGAAARSSTARDSTNVRAATAGPDARSGEGTQGASVPG